METQDGNLDRTTRIIFQRKLVPQPCFTDLGVFLDETNVRRDFLLDRLDHGPELLVTDETDQCRLGVPPGQVREKLVDLIQELLGTSPESAFGDKNVLALVPDQNVCFPGLVERLAR